MSLKVVIITIPLIAVCVCSPPTSFVQVRNLAFPKSYWDALKRNESYLNTPTSQTFPKPAGIIKPFQKFHQNTDNYRFDYNVNDPKTRDMKSHREARFRGVVSGRYQFLQPDGRIRIVDYSSDKNGFKANVMYKI